MKDLIIPILDDIYPKFEKRVPLTKKETVYVNIEDVSPLELPEFMKTNNIPDDAYFGGKPNGYDAIDYVCLCYEIDIPTTEKEQLKFKREKFTYAVNTPILKMLTDNGYKRVGFNSGLLKDFKDTSVYDMYIAKDFDRLVEYYSLSFSFSPDLIQS